MSFFSKQFIDVVEWTETNDSVLAWRFPFEDHEIQNGARLTVRDSQLAVFVNEGRIADAFGPGLYTLSTNTLPLLTNLLNWDKAFKSPFKSDVYFFSSRLRIDQKWGTATPLTIRDREFGAVRIRAYGIFAYRIADPRIFYEKISGSRSAYLVADLEGQLRNTIVGRMTSAFGNANVNFIDMAASQLQLSQTMIADLRPVFADLGLFLDSFTVESISLPEELQKMLDQRIGMNMLGDMNRYTQFQVAQSMPIAAANEGGGAGLGAGLGAGMAMAQQMMNAMQPTSPQQPPPPPQAPAQQGPPPGEPPAPAGGAAGGAATKFCLNCGQKIPKPARFCPECGGTQ
ncbi:MAG TPA: SPFH domain-containing protein [Candidatus Limnocylindrales bacterium]|nr:SPFH domain-containing protein [Candidatus Limnocylindrales bacterium]